jgi:hypothetical protein
MRQYCVGFLVVTATLFQAILAPPPADAATYSLLVSASADRSAPEPLAGKTVRGNIHVFVTPETGIARVRFFLDDPEMMGAPRQTERYAPYDFAGSIGSLSNAFDSTQLPNASHTITAAVDLAVGGTEVVSATFSVAKELPSVTCSLYVSPTGSATASGLTPETATTIGTAKGKAVAGDTVCFLAGTYITGGISVNRSGAAGAPITYRGGVNGEAVIHWAGTNGVRNNIQVGADYIEIQHLTLDGRSGSALARAGVKCDSGHHHVGVRFNIIRYTGSSGFLATGCDYLAAERNLIYHVGYDPAVGWGSGISYNQSGGAFWADGYQGFHSYVVGNIISASTDESYHHSDGNGFINDLGGNTPPVLVANNLIYMNGGRCLHSLGSSHAWYVNNTCYMNGLDTRVGGAQEIDSIARTGHVTTDNHYINNIVHAWTGRPDYRVTSDAASVVFQRNIGWGGSGSPVPLSIAADPEQLRRVPPLFLAPYPVDPTLDQQQTTAPPPWEVGTRFHLRDGSPAIDAGIDPRNAAGMTPEFLADIERYLATDLDGAPRPQGAAYDLGAYER